jgi:hypothetical protein
MSYYLKLYLLFLWGVIVFASFMYLVTRLFLAIF